MQSTDQRAFESFRSTILKRLMDELFGPEPDDDDVRQRELLDVSPLQLYATGVLFPQGSRADDLEDGSSGAGDAEAEVDAECLAAAAEAASGLDDAPVTLDDPEDTPLNLANQFNPSAMGLTVHVPAGTLLDVRVTCGCYAAESVDEPHPRAGEPMLDGASVYPATRTVTRYRRTPLQQDLRVRVERGRCSAIPMEIEGSKGSLRLHVRSKEATDGTALVSLALVNAKRMRRDNVAQADEAFFQAGLSVHASDREAIFHPVERAAGATDDAEQAELNFLYRKRRSFALGHGASATWESAGDRYDRAVAVHSACVPTEELEPVVPREKPFGAASYDLSMLSLSTPEGAGQANETIVEQLTALADDYEVWIEACEDAVIKLEEKFKPAALRNVERCRRCVARIRGGIDYLVNHDEAMKAFRIANRAMLVQQLRTRSSEREPADVVDDTCDVPAGADTAGPRWRPFQLAFILMNVACCADQEHEERLTVDLIWFPTGGGKTEAYLGLAAYCIVLRRLVNPNNVGVTVLMRYTLRLLTAQQFQRAAALITALEVLRQEHFLNAQLGAEPITIGLWVGQSLSPNRRADAVRALNELRTRENASNPFQLLRCPWCRTSLDHKEHLGYSKSPLTSGGTDTVVYRCPNRGCRWHGTGANIPVITIDEDIYDSPPTLLLGTVDKFAQLAWEPRAGALFGSERPWNAPELIIQDELHLISGPLGTIVGLYETVIEELCAANGGSAKIVASTATIREADRQCRGLYARRPFVFPPPGMEAGDSYFAFEDAGSPGRLYVGVAGTAVRSHATAQVRVVSALLQSVMPTGDAAGASEDVADRYATVLWYFNSLRELGHALTMCTGDIPEHHFNICRRQNVPKGSRRLIRHIQELTSRRTADEIPRILEALERPWRPKPDGSWAVDVLLATNMISVGVDVHRLGLMVVAGQPKSTSEYIQVTGRVGRGFPGIVVTVYNPARSRDRSHYEQFCSYHKALYRYVEPSSVTPFSPPARSRAMAGVVIAMARLLLGVASPEQIAEFDDELPELKNVITKRMSSVDPDEIPDAEAEIDAILNEWRAVAPREWGKMAGTPAADPLMRPYGGGATETSEDLTGRAVFQVLTSMRNVDASCAAMVLNRYPDPEE